MGDGSFCRRGAAGIVLAGVCALIMPVSAQNAQNQTAPSAGQDWSRIAGNFGDVKVLPNGGPTPRRRRASRPDRTLLPEQGRTNAAGRLPARATTIMDQFDPAVTPQEPASFKPETRAKYQYPTPYGICAPGGTPTSITTQATEHGPMELIQKPGVVWILTEFPQTHSPGTH